MSDEEKRTFFLTTFDSSLVFSLCVLSGLMF